MSLVELSDSVICGVAFMEEIGEDCAHAQWVRPRRELMIFARQYFCMAWILVFR
jgi:hypothetical protein